MTLFAIGPMTPGGDQARCRRPAQASDGGPTRPLNRGMRSAAGLAAHAEHGEVRADRGAGAELEPPGVLGSYGLHRPVGFADAVDDANVDMFVFPG